LCHSEFSLRYRLEAVPECRFARFDVATDMLKAGILR
jgi:hypothetical protein